MDERDNQAMNESDNVTMDIINKYYPTNLTILKQQVPYLMLEYAEASGMAKSAMILVRDEQLSQKDKDNAKQVGIMFELQDKINILQQQLSAKDQEIERLKNKLIELGYSEL